MDDDGFDNVWGAPSTISASSAASPSATAAPPVTASPASSDIALPPISSSNLRHKASYASELDVWGATPDPVPAPTAGVTVPGGHGEEEEELEELEGDIGSSLDPPPPTSREHPPIPSAAPALGLPMNSTSTSLQDQPSSEVPEVVAAGMAAVTLDPPSSSGPAPPEASTSSHVAAIAPPADDGFDDDDFGEMGAAGDAADDDDFGDFGEFDEAGFESAPADGAGAGAFGFDTGAADLGGVGTPGLSGGEGFGLDWEGEGLPAPKPLDLSRTDSAHVLPQTTSIIESVFPRAHLSLTDEPDRQVEGLAQILTTPQSRSLYIQLTTPPETKPIDWKRSKTRREHLTTLGIPIDLDEIAPASVKPLASLVLPPLSTAGLSPSTSPGPASAPVASSSSGMSFESITSGPSSSITGLGAAPALDRRRVDELLEMSRDTLTLQNLVKLREIKAELDNLTTAASLALTHALQVRESHAQDSETYNKVIQDLVNTARQIRSGTSIKRSSTPTNRPASIGPGGWKKTASPQASLGVGSPPGSAGGGGGGLAQAGVAVPARSMSGDRRFSVR